MDRIIGIDPGVHLCAWTYAYRMRDAVIEAPKIDAVGIVKDNHDEGVNALVRGFYNLGRAYAPTVVVIEHPIIYPMERQKGNPNDIVRLAAVAGVVGAACAAGSNKDCSRDRCELDFVEPRRWKGTTPKHIDNERTQRRCPEAIALMEGIPKGQRNHVWDAIALTLWKAERI